MQIRTDVQLRQYLLQNNRPRRHGKQSFPFLRRYVLDDRGRANLLEYLTRTGVDANTGGVRYGAVLIGRYYNTFFWEELLSVLKREDPLKYIDRK